MHEHVGQDTDHTGSTNINTVLIVAANSGDKYLLELGLCKDTFSLSFAFSGDEAMVNLLRFGAPDLCIIDISLTSKNGMGFAKSLRDHDDYAHIPIIFVNDTVNQTIKSDAFRSGGVDYVVKPFDLFDLENRMRNAILSSSESHKESRSEGLIDALTKLPNKAKFSIDLGAEWKRCVKYSSLLTVMLIELPVSETDAEIKSFASIVGKYSLRQSDIVARIGDTCFAIILPLCGELGARGKAKSIIEHLSFHNYQVYEQQKTNAAASKAKDKTHKLTIGIACTLAKNENKPEILLESAKEALNKAKELHSQVEYLHVL